MLQNFCKDDLKKDSGLSGMPVQTFTKQAFAHIFCRFHFIFFAMMLGNYMNTKPASKITACGAVVDLVRRFACEEAGLHHSWVLLRF